MSTHNICFHGEIRKILCGYSLLTVAMFLQVFKLRTENGLITDAVEVYLNNGTEITGSSVAGVYGNKMIIGSIASQALVCDLIYVD